MPVVEGILISRQTERLGGIEGAARSEGVNQRDHIKVLHTLHDDRGDDGGADQWEGDTGIDLPAGGAIHLPGLHHIARDGLQCCNGQDNYHRNRIPGVSKDQHDICAARRTKKVYLPPGQPINQIRDRSVIAIENPPPQERRHRLGQDPGDNDQGTQERIAPDFAVQQRPDRHTQRDDDHQRQQDISNGIKDVFQAVSGKDGNKVIQSDKRTDLGVICRMKAGSDRHTDGDDRNQHDHKDCRR